MDNAEWGLQLTSLQDWVVGHVRPTLLVFLGAVGLVLLITCANIANLILARMSSRETELGIRTALGADTPRLVGLLLSEGLVLALLGSGVGLLLAWVGTPLFLSLAPAGIPRLEEVGMDWTVLAFTFGLALLATLLFGMAPLARASRVEPMWALRGGRHGKPKRRMGGVNGALVIAEVALALTLLVGAGLLTRSFASFFRWEPGIDRDHILTLSVTATTSEYRGDPEAIIRLYRTIEEQVGSLPGVRGIGRASAGPLFGGWEPDQIHPGPQAGEVGSGRPVRWYDIGPGYFDALGVPILAGRDFSIDDDMEAPRVALVNQSLANRLWPGESPLGKTVWLEMNEIAREVVGVVADIPPLDPDAPVESEIFWPQAQYTRPFSHFVIRTEGDPTGLERPVVDRIKEIDPKIQVGTVWNYRSLLNRRLVQPRFNMLLIGIFSGVAMVLAAVGIFGVVSRSVAARTREIGIRIALGSPRGRVLSEVVGSSMALTGVGVALGLVLALLLSQSIRTLLHGVVPTDPLSYFTVAAGLLAVAFLASLFPALAASRVDPMESLREE
ncbi:FtsX-like permease family protein [Gemmatimonadota bacterium]